MEKRHASLASVHVDASFLKAWAVLVLQVWQISSTPAASPERLRTLRLCASSAKETLPETTSATWAARSNTTATKGPSGTAAHAARSGKLRMCRCSLMVQCVNFLNTRQGQHYLYATFHTQNGHRIIPARNSGAVWLGGLASLWTTANRVLWMFLLMITEKCCCRALTNSWLKWIRLCLWRS